MEAVSKTKKNFQLVCLNTYTTFLSKIEVVVHGDAVQEKDLQEVTELSGILEENDDYFDQEFRRHNPRYE